MQLTQKHLEQIKLLELFGYKEKTLIEIIETNVRLKEWDEDKIDQFLEAMILKHSTI